MKNKKTSKHRQIVEDKTKLKGCLYLQGTNLITNVYSYSKSKI